MSESPQLTGPHQGLCTVDTRPGIGAAWEIHS